jgi:hypothetical protein
VDEEQAVAAGNRAAAATKEQTRMRAKITMAVAASVIGSAIAGPTLAQNVGRPANDGGMVAEPSGSPQYNGSGQVVPAPGAGAGNQIGSNDCARFHSFDPATGTFMGHDGRRHPCP